MRLRHRLSRRASRRLVKRTARVHKRNRPRTMRGGIRL